jgi:hypothetical protein
MEESRFDAKPLNFRVEQGLSRDGQGRKVVKVTPGSQSSEVEWLAGIKSESNHEIAGRLGVTDRQVRRIKTGKVSADRLREHAKADPKYMKEDRRPYPTRVRAALCLLPMADRAGAVCPIAA